MNGLRSLFSTYVHFIEIMLINKRLRLIVALPQNVSFQVLIIRILLFAFASEFEFFMSCSIMFGHVAF